MDKCIEQMKQDLAFARYSDGTQEDDLKTARAFVERVGRPVEQIHREEIRAYVSHLAGQGRSVSWLKMKLAAIVFLFSRPCRG
jgi:site-specific recombinase XerD